MTETEQFVVEAMAQLSMGNDGDATYHPLYKAWRSYTNNPEQLNRIQDYARYGMGLSIFLSYETISDIDIKQQIASISYMCISKAIKNNPSNVNYRKNRLILMLCNHEAFEYTVSSVVNKGRSIIFANNMRFKARDAMFKMEFYDLSSNKTLLNIDMFYSKYIDLKEKISNNFLGYNETEATFIRDGEKLHKDILDYIEDKVLVDGDIDF